MFKFDIAAIINAVRSPIQLLALILMLAFFLALCVMTRAPLAALAVGANAPAATAEPAEGPSQDRYSALEQQSHHAMGELAPRGLTMRREYLPRREFGYLEDILSRFAFSSAEGRAMPYDGRRSDDAF